MRFLYSRKWILGRRIALIAIALVVGYRSYGDSVRSWFETDLPSRDLVLTRSEFRTDLGGERPYWVIGLRNDSRDVAYTQILLEATYLDSTGAVIETDRIRIDQRLDPGQTQDIGSADPGSREGAVDATLEVLDAQIVE